jgi:hypothetical protein
MLASRVLPLIVRPLSPPSATPIATFFHVPRRYVRSNMEVGDTLADSPREDVRPSRSLRKSSRVQNVRYTPTSMPMDRIKEEGLQSPALPSPRPTRKRGMSLEGAVDEEEPLDPRSPTSLKSSRSATSTNSGEFSPHVCLCQPEPKIPRPRNGESIPPLFKDLSISSW